MALRSLGFRMALQIFIATANISPYHTRILLEILQTFLVVLQWAAHTTKTFSDVYTPVLTVIQRMELYSTFLYELQLILITPIKDRIDGVDVILLAAVYPALGRLGISL